MKSRIFSLAALIFLTVAAPVAAIRIQSTAIDSLKLSQIRQEGNPFLIHGRIWGPAPKGDVSRISYRITDTSGTTTWEFAEPFVRSYSGEETLDLDFEFDLSNELLDQSSFFTVEFQDATMNGAFAQTIARGSMPIVFSSPEDVPEKISAIEKFRTFVDGPSIVSQIGVRNAGKTRELSIRARLLDAIGAVVDTKRSAEMTVPAGENKEFSLLFDVPRDSGKYQVEVQALNGKKAITGIKKLPVIVEGDFALLSNLRVLPNEYLYKGETAMIFFSGVGSVPNDTLKLSIQVQDATKVEIFTQDTEVQTDVLGRFSGELSVPITVDTEQLHIFATLKKGEKVIGVYPFSTPIMKKLVPSEGQSSMSFAIERVSQEFLVSSPKAKIGLIAVIALIIVLVVGMIFLLRHMRHTKLLLLGIAFLGGSVVHAAGVTSLYPEHQWVVNPQASAAQENFKKVLFQGTVDFGTGGVFPVSEPIATQVKLGTTETITTSFTTIDPNQYYFIVTVPSTLTDGTYPLELEMTWDGITLPGGSLQIELLYAPGQPLLLVSDGTPPTPSFNYFSGGTLLNSGEYSNVPVELGVVCDDATGCLTDTEQSFEVKGNFCTGGDFCTAGAVDDFVICDMVGNCASPAQVELNQYDPLQPELDDFDITKDGFSAKTQLKALESYVFSFLNLTDPTEDATVVVDENACSNENSPFFVNDSLCIEKVVSCALSPTRRGTLNQQGGGTSCESTDPCPPGTSITPEGDCFLATCDYSHFPYCFEMILDGTCSSFPFCFEMVLE